MLVREDSIPKPNVYSSKILFEQVDDRNKKRMAQMLRRKKAFSVKHNDSKEKEKKNSLIESPLASGENKKDSSFKINFCQTDDIIYMKNDNNSDCEKDIISEIKLDSNINCELNKQFICKNNNINIDNSPNISNYTFFNENNNYYNNSSTNNSNNNSIINRDSQEKEVNISNLENDSIDDIIINKEDNNLEENCLNINDENDKILSKSLYNYDHDDDNFQKKEERRIKEENEFALKYLTSSSDSFVQLDNHLAAKVRAQGADMTESYFQALFPDLIFDNNKPLKTKNYEVAEIIKEEKENDSPFGKTNYFYTHSSKISRKNLENELNLKPENSFGNIKKLKNSLVKTKSNLLLHNKMNNINDEKNNTNKYDINKKNLKLIKYKSVANFKNIKKINKNKEEKITKKKKDKSEKGKLNISSSLSNLNIDKIRNNKLNLKIQTDSELYSTFSLNLNNRGKSEVRKNKKNRNKSYFKNSFTNLLDEENELNDTKLIFNCVKNIGQTKNLKISKHYLKNINFYNEHTEPNSKNKKIIKRNQNKNGVKKINLDTTVLNNTTRLTNLKTTDIIKRPKYTLIKNDLEKNLSRIDKNYISTNINSLQKINKKIKNRNCIHRNCISSIYSNGKIKQKKCIIMKDRVKSFSKLITKKNEIYDITNIESTFRRTKSIHKKLNTISNYDLINTETSTNKIKIRKNNNMSNNIFPDKKKIVHYKKIDYSYVKAKVETGLSEEILKKLLNNNKKINNKETANKIEQEKKQSLFRKCKTNMNRTIEYFKSKASNIKKKLLKNDKK